MATEELAPAGGRQEVMHVVVRPVVEEVSDYESCEKRLADGPAESEREERIEDDRQGHAGEERHHQTVPVARILVVDPVQQKVDALAGGGLVRPVEDELVKDVLGERPGEHSEEEHRRHRHRPHGMVDIGSLVAEHTPNEKKHRDWKPDDEWGRGMNAREPFEKIALEHPASLRLRVAHASAHTLGKPGLENLIRHHFPLAAYARARADEAQ